MIRALLRRYSARGDRPEIERVDTAMFVTPYFAACMACGFCRDACCRHGADLSRPEAERILEAAPELAARVGSLPERWIDRSVEVPEPDFAGGRRWRTAMAGNACVFLDTAGRGCKLHGHQLATGGDPRDLKPMVCTLFPVSFDAGTLVLSGELADGSLVCAGPGATAYRAVRGDLGWYFGAELVAELDAIETDFRSEAPAP